MQTQDIEQLKQILQLTLGSSQQQIAQGEQFLNIQSQLPNYASSLMMIADDATNEINIRLSAVINLKTFIEKSWKKRSENKFSLPENEKLLIKNTIIDALIRCVGQKKLRNQYEDLMYKLVAIDFPQQWPELVPMIISKLQSMSTFEEIFGTLLALRRICENFQFMLDQERLPLYPIVSQSFPILEGLFQKSLENYNEQTGLIVKIIMKIFHHSMHLELPEYLLNQQIIEKWFQFFTVILRSPVPPELLTPTVVDEEIVARDKHYLWTNKKWAGRIMQRFIQKFFNESFVKENQVELSRFMLKTYAPAFMDTFFQLLVSSQTQFVAPRTSLFALKFLYYSLKLKLTKELLAPHLDKLLFDIAIPKMQLTPMDDKLWKSDPEEYIRKLEDFTIASYNIKNAANDLFQILCLQKDSQGQDYLINFLNYCQVCFSSGVDPRTNQQIDLLKKEALLWGIETLSLRILKIDAVKQGMETMLEKYILPELQNNIGFLRARACNLFSQYGSIEFKNKANIHNAVTGIYNCILDKELPVRVAAAQSFSAILSHQEAQEMVRPGLNKILEIYINLMNIIDNEHLVKSLEIIVENFSKEISPYAEQLAAQLANVFHKYCKKQNQGIDESDDDGEAELAAVGCLDAIKRIMSSSLSQQSYQQLEQIICPILNFCFTESGCDFVGEALEILNLLVYKQKGSLSPGLWFYYPVLCYIIIGLPKEIVVRNYPGLTDEQYILLEGCKEDWGSEFLKNMIGCFRNYIQKGGEAFLTQNDMFGNQLVQLIFNMAQKVYQIGDNGEDDTDMSAITTLFITLIENLKGKIDHLVEPIIQIVLGNLQKKKSKHFRLINYSVVMMLFWYNPYLTLTILNKSNLAEQFLQTVFENKKIFTSERDLHILFLGICTIYTLPQEQIPNYLIANASLIGKYLLEMTTKMLELREESDSDEEEIDLKCGKEDQGYKKTVQQIEKSTGKDDDEDDLDFDEDEDLPFESLYESPSEEIDATMLFEQLLLNLQQTNPGLYQLITSQWTNEDQQTLMKNIVEVKKQYQEWLSFKNK